MQCNYCGQQHSSHFVYCPNTSNLIDDSNAKSYTYSTTEFCVNCGTKNELGYSYCVKCGHSNLMKVQKNNISTSTVKILNKVHINTDNIKSTSVESLNYIKRNKLMIVPILISMIIMILGAFWIKSSALSAISDELGYFEEETIVFAALLKPEMLEEMVYDEFGVDVDVPNFTSFPIMMALIHNVDLDFHMTVGAMGEQEGIKVSLKNIFTGLLLIPIIALFIGGIVYGRMALKNNWPIYKGILYSVLSYTVVMSILAIFARVSFNQSVDPYYTAASLKINLSTSFIDILLTSIILSTLVFGSAALTFYFGKSIFSNTIAQSKVVIYAFSALVATIVGLIINYIYSLLFIMEDFMRYGPDIPHFIMAMYTSIATWLMSILGQFQIGNGHETYSYRALFNGRGNEVMIDMFGSDMLFHNMLFLFLIAIIIIAAVGYFVYQVHQLNVRDIAIFGLLFTVIQLFMVNGFSITVGIDYLFDYNSITIGFELVSTCIFAFIISFVSFYGGGYLRKVLMK